MCVIAGLEMKFDRRKFDYYCAYFIVKKLFVIYIRNESVNYVCGKTALVIDVS